MYKPSAKPLLSILIAVVLVSALSGCATYYGAAEIISTPPGAQVIDTENNEVLGVTPMIVHWKDSSRTRQYVALRLKKEGFRPDVAHFWVSMRHKSQNAAETASEQVSVELDQK